MPATARSYGLRFDSWVDERLDPEKSTKAAMLYLKDLYGMFGCWRLAVSAYNSGENKLNKVLCQEDAKEYDEICSSRRLRRETREFWPRFQALAHIAKDPAKYGFGPLRLKAYQRDYGLVTTESSYSLARLAQLAGVSEQKLAEMNPSLIRNMTPDNGPTFSLKVPLDKRDVLVARLKDAPSEPPRSQIVHVVNKGDSLGRILKRYQVSKSQLAGVNPDVNLGRRLPKGAKIVIPVEKKEPRAKARLGDRA
jgi:membrane-bound lytic murein transglycosylase D